MIKIIAGILVVAFLLIVLIPKYFPIRVPEEEKEWIEDMKQQSRQIIQDWKAQTEATSRSLVKSSEDRSAVTLGPSILPSQELGYGINSPYCPQGGCAGTAYSYSYILSYDLSYDPFIICYASGTGRTLQQRYWGYDETITGPTPKQEYGCFKHKECCSPIGWNMMAQQTYGY
jgi:hypothetical protein